MKRIFLSAALFLILIGAFFIGNFVGKKDAEEKFHFVLVTGAEQQLALLLEVFKELENRDQSKATLMLQTSTAGELETVMDYANFENNPATKFRCTILNRYKKYYDENQLFKTKDWADLMQVQGMQEAANKRSIFFEKKLPVVCTEKTN